MSLLELGAKLLPSPLSLLPMLILSLATQKYAPETTKTLKKEYDYIVVGAGSAGSVVASRLSELPCVSVLLLEAGPPPPWYTEVPILSSVSQVTGVTWKFKTEPQKHAGSSVPTKQYSYGVGKTLGGSSTVNGMLVSRGNPQNYDEWAAMGAEGWNYGNVTKYFLKLEDDTTQRYLADGYHSTGGPVAISVPEYQPELKQGVMKAAANLNYKFVDPNGPRQLGFYDLQSTTRNGQRCSTAKAYLVPSENRTNLDIVVNAMVTKIVIENNLATGVEFYFNSGLLGGLQRPTHSVRARREVIVSAGAINTPKLLMLSGIGPKRELKRLNIPLVVDLPVGQNLQDHCGGFLAYQLKKSIPTILRKITSAKSISDYITKREGIYTSPSLVSLLAFLSNNVTGTAKDVPDHEIYFIEVEAEFSLALGLSLEAFTKVYLKHSAQPMGMCMSQVLHPKSRGSVRLRSKNPKHDPVIDPNYLADPQDLEDIIAGLKVCLKIFADPAMNDVVEEPFNMTYPGCEKYVKNSDDFLRCVTRAIVISSTHPAGTAKMGASHDPTTVVDPRLRVKGVAGLRVVDASVMPTITWGNPNIPTIMIAEKASDMIKNDVICIHTR